MYRTKTNVFVHRTLLVLFFPSLFCQRSEDFSTYRKLVMRRWELIYSYSPSRQWVATHNKKLFDRAGKETIDCIIFICFMSKTYPRTSVPEVRLIINSANIQLDWTWKWNQCPSGLWNNHGEFDPGSERTLAARLKYASRTARSVLALILEWRTGE